MPAGSPLSPRAPLQQEVLGDTEAPGASGPKQLGRWGPGADPPVTEGPGPWLLVPGSGVTSCPCGTRGAVAFGISDQHKLLRLGTEALGVLCTQPATCNGLPSPKHFPP